MTETPLIRKHHVDTLTKLFFSAGFTRLILASIVVVGHMCRLNFGRMAVYLFFMLSGYWIAKMWRFKYSGCKQPYMTFLASRVWRIFPCFWIINLLSIAVYWITNADLPFSPIAVAPNFLLFGYSSLYASSFSGAYLPPAWSLDVECQYYLVAPVFVAALAMVTRSIGVRTLVVVFAIYTLGFFSLQLFTRWELARTFLPYLGVFGFGVAYSLTTIRNGKALSKLSAAAVLTTIIALLFSPWRDIIVAASMSNHLFAFNEIALLLLALIAAPYILSTVHNDHSFNKPMGDLSYIVYLVHWPVTLAYGYYTRGASAQHKAGFAVLALILIAAVTYIVWRFFDVPVDASRAQWVRSRKKLAS